MSSHPVLAQLLKEEANKHCADCGQKGRQNSYLFMGIGTRWASWNLGIFLCIRCGGLHRKLGTHISRVKSVTLDAWTEEQVESMRRQGNAAVNALYNPFPERHKFPTFSGDQEQFIRDKYERRLFASASGRSSSGPTSPAMATASQAPKQTVDLLGGDLDDELLIPLATSKTRQSPPMTASLTDGSDWADIEPVQPAIIAALPSLPPFSKPLSPPPVKAASPPAAPTTVPPPAPSTAAALPPVLFDDPWRVEQAEEDPFSFK